MGYFNYPTEAIQHARDEQNRQHEKWGEQNRCPTAWIAICTEELGEATKHALTLDLVTQTPEVYREELAKYRAEMVQLAACALSAIDCIDRDKWIAGELRSGAEGKPEN